MNSLENIRTIKESLPPHVKLVAVTKMRTIEAIMEIYAGNFRVYGENRVQELAQKYTQMPKDIEWHMIGHLQSNKVKSIVPFVTLIHSVDSEKLLNTIDFEAGKCGRVIDCLLEIHIAEENTKYGFSIDEVHGFLGRGEYRSLANVRIAGVMGMATFSNDESLVRSEFRNLKKYFDEIRTAYFPGDEHFREISMGMSGDYKIAVEEGSTMVRIGTSIFGEIG